MTRNSQNDSYAGGPALMEAPERAPQFVEERLRIPTPPVIEDRVVEAYVETEPPRRQEVSIFAILGFALAAGLLALTLLARVNLTYVQNDTQALTKRLEELEDERRILLLKSQTSVDLELVEALAVSELGMVKGRSNGPEPALTEDQIVVFDNRDAAPGFGEKLGIFVRSFREYFKGGLSYNY